MAKRLDRGLSALVLLALSTLNFNTSTAFAQNTTFTYQGRITANGTNFTGTGQFKFALGTNTTAVLIPFAEVYPVNTPPPQACVDASGAITNIFLYFGGSGYTSTPAVYLGPVSGGFGAAATAIVSGGSVVGFNIIAHGSDYFGGANVNIAPPPPSQALASLWSNDGSSTGSLGQQPATAVSVPVTNGLFTVVLGDTTLSNMTPIPASLFAQPGLLLQTWFNDGTHGFAALTPPQILTATPYAAYAATAANVANIAAANIVGTIAATNLPASVITNGASGVNFSGPVNVNSSTIINASGVIYSVNGLILENRTNDPASPATGRLWLRTDL